jgi:hypothetical protein
MRTTLDIEDDVLQAVKELAQREGGTAGKVISNLARRGLTLTAAERKNRSGMRGGVPLLPPRGKLVTLEHVQKTQNEEGV